MPTGKDEPVKRNKRESLDGLFDAFSEMIYPTTDDLRRELEIAGINPESVSREARSFIQKLRTKTRVDLAKKEMLEKVKAAKEAISSLAPELSAKNKKQLAKMLFGDQASIAINFNKLGELSDEDIIGLLNELQLLEFLENLKDRE